MRWFYVCPVCKNKDKKYLAINEKGIYCRKCILLSKSNYASKNKYLNQSIINANLKYQLSKTQLKASNQILNYVKNNKSVIVNAVCGAGKTELVYQSIEYMLNQNKIVAFAVPRKDVVIEIYNRLVKDYPNVDVSCVYGGNTSKVTGQLIVLTTHQLFRYKRYFDLLILDEADAYPFYGNQLLNEFLYQSIKGPIIYLSATIKDSYLKQCKNIVLVNKRFHNHDIPIPKVIRYYFFNKIDTLKKIISLERKKPILIFVPTISVGKKLSHILNIPFVYSSYKHKQEYVDMFKESKISILITTSILERGITLKNVQVIVYEASHQLFDESSLIQIAGRVGRKIDAPTGNVYFLTNKKTTSINLCIKKLKQKNKAIV